MSIAQPESASHAVNTSSTGARSPHLPSLAELDDSRRSAHVRCVQQEATLEGRPNSNINTTRANTAAPNTHENINRQQASLLNQNVPPSMSPSLAEALDGNIHPSTLAFANAICNARPSPQTARSPSMPEAVISNISIQDVDTDEQPPTPQTLALTQRDDTASTAASASSSPNLIDIFSNVRGRMPWYFPVFPFKTEPTHTLQNPSRQHQQLTRYPLSNTPVDQGWT